MKERGRGGWSYRLAGVLLVIALGAFAGYMTSVRAGRPRASMAITGALFGAFVAFSVLLQFVQITKVTKRTAAAVAGVVAAVTCGFVMSWGIGTIAGVAAAAAVIGVFADKWARSITF